MYLPGLLIPTPMKFLIGLACFFYSATLWAQIEPVQLRCEYRFNPLGIDVAQPRLSWQLQSEARERSQSAYEIIVASGLIDIQRLQGNTWNSGKITSSEQNGIVYQGPTLQAFTRYYWRVRVYDQAGKAGAWSEPAWFETAMLSTQDWIATWIGDGSKQFSRDEDFYQDDRMPVFKKIVATKKEIRSARLYISGLGYYEAFLNGNKIGDQVLEPGWTTYSKEVLYSVYDITGSLAKGDNVMSVMLGNGWYNPLPLRMFSRFNLREVQETGRPRFIAEIHIRYKDGTLQKIPSDTTWLSAPGPIVRNNVYLGEHYDARLEQEELHRTASNRVDWKAATKVPSPSGTLSAQMQPPIRVKKAIQPVSIKAYQPGVYIADMGENFAGVAQIRVSGPAGTQIRLKYGEALHPDGSLNYLTTIAGQIKSMWKVNGGPGAPADAWQEDVYTLKGNGIETWSPRFTFHGFRYVEIRGWPGEPGLDAITGLKMHADLENAGTFACSNEMFNTLHEVIRRTFLSNVFSVQSDCPGREKMGYGADIVVSSEAFLYNFDMAQFYRKAVRDFANEQAEDGGITETAPYYGIADRGYGGRSGPLGWQLAFPYAQKQLYDFYGDKQIIETYYPAIVRQMDFLQAKAVDGLYHWDISDHEALDPKPEAFSASAFYYHHAVLASEFAGILGKAAEAEKYAKLATQIKERIVRKYYIPHTGRFDNATQSAQFFALWYGLSPEPEKSFEVLEQEFERHKYHVSSGIFGVKMMFDVLRKLDQNPLAYTLANQRDFPGWGYMLAKGATTLWETWEYPDNAPSQNHPMFGSIDEWFYRSILGINPLEAGFNTIQIKPQPAGDLTWARGSYLSVRGPIVSDWKIENGLFSLNVSIPANTRGEVWIPLRENQRILESGQEIAVKRREKSYAVVEIGSGSYSFRVSGE